MVTVILVLFGTFAVLVVGGIIAGVVAWRIHSKSTGATARPAETVDYSSSPPQSNPTSTYPAPAYPEPPYPAPSEPQSVAEDNFAPAIDGGEPVAEAAPTGDLPAPAGLRLELAASVNSEQTIIYLNDVAPLVGVRLPCSIRIDDETMRVTAADGDLGSVTVERDAGAYHSVSATVEVVQAP